jgi:MYXO-CTERM domain-containing protein
MDVGNIEKIVCHLPLKPGMFPTDEPPSRSHPFTSVPEPIAALPLLLGLLALRRRTYPR